MQEIFHKRKLIKIRKLIESRKNPNPNRKHQINKIWQFNE